MYTTDFLYDGPIFLVPLSPSYPSSPVVGVEVIVVEVVGVEVLEEVEVVGVEVGVEAMVVEVVHVVYIYWL